MKWKKICSFYSIFIKVVHKIMGIIAVLLLIYYNTPIKGFLKDTINFEITEMKILVIFIPILCWMIAEVLTQLENILKGMNKRTMVTQDEIITHCFSKLTRSNSNVDILIYTSYSIFNKFEQLVNKYPKLASSKIRILLKDPDQKMLINNGKKSNNRTQQLMTALYELTIKSKKYNVQVRFYRNEPWVRGINIEDKHLFYSTYGGKEDFDVPVEYSGSNTPWIELKAEDNDENKFIDSFKSLYDIIWNNCTKYKNIILDLQGTIFENEEMSKIFSDAPIDYINENYKEHSKEIIENYERLLSGKEYSATESVIKSIINVENSDYEEVFSAYTMWKSKIEIEDVVLNKLEKLENVLRCLNETYNIYLVTNHLKVHTDVILRKIGVSEFFDKDKIITVDELKMIKPNIGIKDYLRNNKSICLEDSIFIGDREEIDLAYIREEALGLVLVNQPEFLSDFMENLQYSYRYAKSMDYCGIKIIK